MKTIGLIKYTEREHERLSIRNLKNKAKQCAMSGEYLTQGVRVCEVCKVLNEKLSYAENIYLADLY